MILIIRSIDSCHTYVYPHTRSHSTYTKYKFEGHKFYNYLSRPIKSLGYCQQNLIMIDRQLYLQNVLNINCIRIHQIEKLFDNKINPRAGIKIIQITRIHNQSLRTRRVLVV